MTFQELLRWGGSELTAAEVPEAELNAWYLLQACVRELRESEGQPPDFNRTEYFLRRDEAVSLPLQQDYATYIEKRGRRIPLEHITGQTEFMGLPFWVNEHVLIPRQDTETLVEFVVPFCEGKRILDLCTGSGCIGLSIAVHGNPSEVVLSDISPDAIEVAERNIGRLRPQFQTEVTLACGDLFEQVKGKFDVIISNPPYIESEVIPGLMPEVSRYEPRTALDGGRDGLDFYRRIIQGSGKYLNPGGILCFEIGYNQGEGVASLMKENGFYGIEIRQDLAGNDRIVKGSINSL